MPSNHKAVLLSPRLCDLLRLADLPEDGSGVWVLSGGRVEDENLFLLHDPIWFMGRFVKRVYLNDGVYLLTSRYLDCGLLHLDVLPPTPGW